jgi:hypothetical protein
MGPLRQVATRGTAIVELRSLRCLVYGSPALCRAKARLDSIGDPGKIFFGDLLHSGAFLFRGALTGWRWGGSTFVVSVGDPDHHAFESICDRLFTGASQASIFDSKVNCYRSIVRVPPTCSCRLSIKTLREHRDLQIRGSSTPLAY